MKQIINGIKYWGQLLLLPIYWLSFLFPRDKHIWLFGSTFGKRFADNPRYFYLYVSQHSDRASEQVKACRADWVKAGHAFTEDENCKGIRPIWISHDKEIACFLNENGYEAYYHHSMKGIWYALRGKVYLFDNYSKDISFWLSGGALKFNMWHGVPLKKIQADNVFDKVRHPKNGWEAFKFFPRRLSDEKPSHYVLATSEFMKPIFGSAFQTQNVSTVGYPRIDSFAFDCIENLHTETEQRILNRIQELLEKNADSKMIYYMPTFRNSETEFFDKMDLESFNRFLQENHLIFCTKLHPKSKLRAQFLAIEKGNIVNIDADTDPYVFIPISDVLVTDYSSIYFDYLFAGKPILFFDYDLNTYLQDSREMYFDYEHYTPGVKAGNQAELEQALSNITKGVDEYKEAREDLQKKIYDMTEAYISGDLAKEIQGIL
ncbi:MAG: CDP-glycerol glycerophosphotransferase family protein [Clostridium sp.]|nr:CDP-glycerol glycerophosphotransferase family protein [Clostridium sp.]